MAQLDVQPKKSNPWWIWLLLAIIAIAILFFFLKGRNHTTTTTTTIDSSTTTSGTSATKPAVAVTQPDWSSVDLNSPNSADPTVTDKDIAVSSNGKYTIYTLGENILFATAQNTLQGTADEKLKMITASINKRFKGASIGVFGNTDSTGTADVNKQLGAERATAVRNWLITTGGLDSTKVSIHSMGSTKPVASNATASGRQQNRNVKIVAFPDSTSH